VWLLLSSGFVPHKVAWRLNGVVRMNCFYILGWGGGCGCGGGWVGGGGGGVGWVLTEKCRCVYIH